ncbi:MAG: Gfo/Idh/MocA family oxidoreductase [Bryobacteraceae bacterium]|nr:Gfo/Idh/MocA family oxidoreductase [Bryobacteraceae bacterium]
MWRGKLRGALVGCGFFGRIQHEAWGRIPEVEIVAACDRQLDRARALAPRAYCSAAEMLDREELDFLDVATGPETHLELVRMAAQRGLPVICQKPMARDWREAVALVETAEAAGVRLIVHENWRWQPWYREAAARIREGAIGQPVTYLFRTRRNDGGGAAPYPAQPYFRNMPRLLVFETLVHLLDTARMLFGEIEAVFALLRRLNPAIAGEDHAALLIRHVSGIFGVVDGHRFLDLSEDSPPMGDAFFEGDRGMLHVSAEGHLLRDGRLLWENRIREGYRGDSVRAAQQHFLRCLLDGVPAESEGREYLKTFAAVEAAYRSAAEGRLVKLEEVRAC